MNPPRPHLARFKIWVQFLVEKLTVDTSPTALPYHASEKEGASQSRLKGRRRQNIWLEECNPPKYAWCGSLIAEKQIQKSTAVRAAGSTATGRHRHQCKGKGNFLRLWMPSYYCRKMQKTGKKHRKIRKKRRTLAKMS